MNRKPILGVLGCWLAGASLLSAQQLVISTFAGTGEKGFSGDGGPAAAAQLNDPTGIARGPDGALYICDTGNHRIRRVTRDGQIMTVAGTGEKGWSGDGGPATAARLNEPYEVRFDASGNVYWVERSSHTVRRREATTGIVSTIAGSGVAGFSGDGGPAIRAQLNDPHSIGFGPDGDLYICDVKNHRVRRVEVKTGTISTYAGTGEGKPVSDGASIRATALHGPRALDFSPAGDLWVALREGNAILKLSPPSLGSYGVASPPAAGSYGVASGEKATAQLVAGTGKKGFTGDGGSAKAATLSGPKGLSIGPNGNVYFADTENHAVRMIDTKRGVMELVAGTGIRGNGSESEPRRCALSRPHGVFVDGDGTIFIGDSEAHRVRVIRTKK